jgi:hypothetical protein
MHTYSQGGAFANEANSDARFENTNFYLNEASFGGALYVSEYSNAKVLGSDFDRNLAINGGAIFNGGSSNIVDSTFDDNSAEDSVSRSYIDKKWSRIHFVTHHKTETRRGELYI